MPVVLAILSLSIMLRAFAMDILLPGVPYIADEFNVAFSTTQWILSTYFFGAGIGQLVMGPLADKFGRRRVLLFTMVLFIVASVICGSAQNVYELIFLRFIQGLGACGATVTTMAIIRDLYSDHATPRVYSYFNGIVGLAPMIAPIVAGYLLVLTGTWRSSFYFVAVFGFVALVINFIYVRDTKYIVKLVDTHKFKLKYILKGYRQVLFSKDFLSYNICAITGLSCLLMFFSTSSIILIKTLGVPPNIYGYYFAANSIMYLAGNVVSPMLQGKVGVNGTILCSGVFMLLGGACMLLIYLTLGLSVLGILIPNAIATFGVGFMFGPSMAGAVKNYKHIAGIASASYGAFLYCGSALLVGIIMNFKFDYPKALSITEIFLGLVSILIMQYNLKAKY